MDRVASPPFHCRSQQSGLNSGIHEGRKELRRDQEVSVLRVISRRRFCGDRLGERLSLFLESSYLVANGNQHFPELGEASLIADGSMSWNHGHLIGNST